MDGDAEVEIYGNEALPRLLAEGWDVQSVPSAGKEQGEHIILIKTRDTSDLLAAGPSRPPESHVMAHVIGALTNEGLSKEAVDRIAKRVREAWKR